MKIKVSVIVGTRPEIIRLSRVICLLREHTELSLIHTGQNYDRELNEIFFSELSIPSPTLLLSDQPLAGPCDLVGKAISGFDQFLSSHPCDAVLVLGDTNSALSVYAAKRRGIPIFHMEAGNRCFDRRVPEEINRKIVDHLADVNLPYSQIAREHLIREGLPSNRIVVTGSPLREVIDYYSPLAEKKKTLSTLSLSRGNYVLASLHREENVDSVERLQSAISALEFIAEKTGKPLVLSLHPRTKKKIEYHKIQLSQKIQLHKPFGFLDYLNLQKNAHIVISDSGTVFEEAEILGVPAVCLRDSHERPESLECGLVPNSGLNKEALFMSYNFAIAGYAARQNTPEPIRDYQSQTVSWKVLNTILSYYHTLR